MEYGKELLEVQIVAFSGWPEKYRPSVNAEQFLQGLNKWRDLIVYGGFERETGTLVAYAQLNEYKSYANFSVL